MTHEGSMLSNAGSTVNFYGLRWKNSSSASILDESNDGMSGTGGWFQFIQPGRRNPNVVYQFVSGGFNVSQNAGPAFTNIRLINSPGLVLDDLNDLKITHELDLSRGMIFLNGWNLMIGHHNPGFIRNFSDSNFIVTGNHFGGGFLYRSELIAADGPVVFPIGTRPESFTPAVVAVQNNGGTFRAGVSDSVLAQLTQGRNLFSTSVNKTWQIDALNTATDANITLVHLFREEGPDYEANRNSSYVAFFNGSNWDTAGTRSAPTSPSIYTSGSPIKDAAFNSRSFQLPAASHFFTSMVAEIVNSPNKTLLQFFDAFRSNSGNDSIILRWATSREYYCAGFSIERKLLDGANFDSIGFVHSKSPNGISYVPVGYDSLDIMPSDVSLMYRLKVTMTDGSFFYSPIRVVKGRYNDGEINLYPNPVRAGTTLHVYYGAPLHIKALALIDVPGHRLGYREFPAPVNTQNYYELVIPTNLSAGTYFLQFIGQDNQIITTEKVLIINKL